MPTKKDVVQTESEVEGAPTGNVDPFYMALTAEFDKTYQRPIGRGQMLDYITGEQAISRLNDVVGPMNWDWEVTRSEIVDGQIIVRGTLTIRYNGQVSVKTGSGGFIPRANMTLGDATKSAETDAFKKAAQKFGVALYLAEKSGEGVAELPYQPQVQSYPTPTISSLPSVKFPQNTSASGNEVSGVVTAKSVGRNSIQVNGEWYKLAGRSVTQYQNLFDTIQTGQAVSIVHPEGMTFINGLKILDTQAPVAVGGGDEEEGDLAF